MGASLLALAKSIYYLHVIYSILTIFTNLHDLAFGTLTFYKIFSFFTCYAPELTFTPFYSNFSGPVKGHSFPCPCSLVQCPWNGKLPRLYRFSKAVPWLSLTITGQYLYYQYCLRSWKGLYINSCCHTSRIMVCCHLSSSDSDLNALLN